MIRVQLLPKAVNAFDIFVLFCVLNGFCARLVGYFGYADVFIDIGGEVSESRLGCVDVCLIGFDANVSC